MSTPLDKLHDFYQPTPPAWTPQTIGWYVSFAIIGLFLLWIIVRTIRKWLANRYRREALRELVSLPPNQFSTLLKRTALAAWPREKIASLSGEAWLSFLSETARGSSFQNSPGDRIEEVALRPSTLSTEDEQALRKATADWIRRHRVQA
jgi:hypothetical protein